MPKLYLQQRHRPLRRKVAMVLRRFRTFIELAAPQIARTRYGGTIATLDLGAAYLLSNAWQIDTALYEGLNHNTADLTWTIGLSARF